jgi:uncharacterized protein
VERRSFLQQGNFSLFMFLTGISSQALAAQDAALFNELPGELQAPDQNGIRLPAGFTSRVVAKTGQPVLSTSNYRWHPAPDGGATYATADGGWVYVSNSEIKKAEGGGGAGAIRFDRNGKIVDAYSILAGSDNNCAGGKTPWETWLSCEEVERGLVHECDPLGKNHASARPALGLFKHEAVAVDPVHGHLYLTEDERDGCFYRFIPTNALPDISAGRLQVMQALPAATGYSVRWHDVADPQATTVPTRNQIALATRFNGGEGIAYHEGLIHFTTKGDNRVWRLDTVNNELVVVYDALSSMTPHLTGVDNVTITAAGDVLVAEDGGDMQIVLLGPEGLVLPVLQVTGHLQSEITGPAFDPSFQRLYFSSQRGPTGLDGDGITYEISRSTAIAA